ncbi:hypothetical protein [Lentzea terrae]|uniref:hypothetical protein n=1 Tax=Lentzea terrae TaxID=2200761 RepID=UPI000DD33BF0|nr:hypothetical protein [Lentzea terrae]
MDEQALPHTVLQLDIVASSKGSVFRQVHLDKALDKVITDASSRCSFVDGTWFHRITGDSAVLAAPSSVPKAFIAADFVRELSTALRNFNSMMNESGRLRARLAIDHGDVVRHGLNINGTAVVRAARLCDSEALRDALRRNDDADLAVVLTDPFYDDAVVEGNRGLDKAEFTFVHDRVKDREVSGWIWLPGNKKPGSDGKGRGDAPRPGPRTSPEPRPTSGGGTHLRDVTIHGNGVVGTNGTQHNYYGDDTRTPRPSAD